MSFCKVLPGSELLPTITHVNKRKWPERIYALPVLWIKVSDPKENVLLKTSIRSCDIFKKSQFRNIQIALYSSIIVIINVKINGWTGLIFFNRYTMISLPAGMKIWIGFIQTTTLLGLFIHFMSKRFGSIKHQISRAVVIIMWSRVMPSIQALTLSHHQAGYKMADTCMRAHVRRWPFPLFSERPVSDVGGRSGQEPGPERPPLLGAGENNPLQGS